MSIKSALLFLMPSAPVLLHRCPEVLAFRVSGDVQTLGLPPAQGYRRLLTQRWVWLLFSGFGGVVICLFYLSKGVQLLIT